jgi:hypothetical protein
MPGDDAQAAPLDQGATVPDTVLGFAILVALAVAASGWALLGRRPRRSQNERMHA